MPSFPPLYVASPRGQCAVILLAALHEMLLKDAMSVVTKQQAIQRIKVNQWFDLQAEDREPYQSQRLLSGEPRWQTLIAWARKDNVLRDLVSYQTRDAWGLTSAGRSEFERIKMICTSQNVPISECFLWSLQFKEFMKADFIAGPTDKKRPANFYRDTMPDVFTGFTL